MTDVPPTQIGKYQIVGVVGEGAMGTVYRAVDSVIGRTVAVKVMNAAIARDKTHRERFLREAQAAGSLQHPNVVTIYDLGELDGHLFIAMEFLHGSDLEKLIERPEQLKLQSKLDIMVDVLIGLSYAHKNGIIHRDIKPANIRVAEDGKAKIMDFGVAHLASSDMTRTGLVVGTPSYMAPEQVTGAQVVPGTDIFAVGAVLYHLLTGSKPFEGPTLQSLFYRIVTDMPRPLDEVRPGLPVALNGILQKAMAKHPDDRYSSALEMANAIISVRAELSGNPYASSASLTSSLSNVAEPIVPKTVPITGSSRVPWKAITAGVGAAAVVLFAWLVLGPRNGVADDSKATARDTVASTASPSRSEVQPAPPPVVAPETAATKDVPGRVTPAPRVTERKQVAKKAAPPPPPARERTVTRQAPARDTPIRVVAAPPAAPTPSPPATTAVIPPPPPPPPPPAPVSRPVETLAAPRPAPREEIAAAVAAYARAIESRDISAVRRAYPGITAEQARGFEQFFASARNINVTFQVTEVETSGNTADARLVGTYQYVSSDGRAQRQPVSFGASLRYDGSSWQLRSVR